MVKLISCIAVLGTLLSCNYKKNNPAVHYPSEQYEYFNPDTSNVSLQPLLIYVPIYSHIYILNGTRPLNLAATLSIRSTDFTDSIFISKVDYYNSKGQLVKKYLSKTLLLKPMHSAEFIVEESNTEGGAGAYFIINSLSKKSKNNLLVEAIMVSQSSSLGITFKSEGIILTQ